MFSLGVGWVVLPSTNCLLKETLNFNWFIVPCCYCGSVVYFLNFHFVSTTLVDFCLYAFLLPNYQL